MSTPVEFMRNPSMWGTDDPGVRWRVPAEGLTRDLVAAILGHYVTYKIRRAIGGRGLTHTQYAEQAEISTKALRSILTGQRLPTIDDLAAAVTVFTTSVLPEPAAVRELLRGAREALRSQEGASRAEPGDPMHAIEGYRTLAALGAAPDAVAEHPLTAEEQATEQRLRATATPLIAEAVRRLSQTEVINPRVHLARDAYLMPTDVLGYADPKEAALEVRLRDSWPEAVLAPGFATLDGWFVLDIEGGGRGEPAQALVLDLAPDLMYQDPESPPAEPDRRFVARSARITWTTGRPVVDVSSPRGTVGGRE